MSWLWEEYNGLSICGLVLSVPPWQALFWMLLHLQKLQHSLATTSWRHCAPARPHHPTQMFIKEMFTHWIEKENMQSGCCRSIIHRPLVLSTIWKLGFISPHWFTVLTATPVICLSSLQAIWLSASDINKQSLKDNARPVVVVHNKHQTLTRGNYIR